jgi:UDP-glucose 4-epimerase
MAKVVVTGGAGFIGSYITRELVQEGHDVIILDSFSQYVSPLDSNYQWYLKARFEGIDERKLTIIRGDTRNAAATRRVFMEHKPDRVVHMAALPIATISDYYAEEAIACILLGTVNILEIIRDVDFIDKFVYASSSMVYGDFQYCPADEEHPKAPKGIYGGAKYAGEIMTQVYGRRFGIDYTIIRPSAVYGPTDSNRRVSQIFVENALRGEPLQLDGGGTQTLDFTYVTDAAHGFVLATFHEAAQNEVFNITRGEGRSLKEFAEILSRIVPGVSTVEVPANEIRPKRGALDISKARRMLGYEPQYSLENGLEDYVEFVRKFIGSKEL